MADNLKERIAEMKAAAEKALAKSKFDNCSYRSKSGKRGCGALRYYHHEMSKNHDFVESTQERSVEVSAPSVLALIAEIERQAAEITELEAVIGRRCRGGAA